MAKLTENRIRKIVKESINKILMEEQMDDDVVFLYHITSKKHAIAAINGNYSVLHSRGAVRYGDGIYGCINPKDAFANRKLYGCGTSGAIVKIVAPASAVKRISTMAEGEIGVISDINQIYQVDLYKAWGVNESTINRIVKESINKLKGKL